MMHETIKELSNRFNELNDCYEEIIVMQEKGEQIEIANSAKLERLKMNVQAHLDLSSFENVSIAYSHNIIGDPYSVSVDIRNRQIFFNTDIDEGGAVTFLKYIKAIFNFGGEEDDITIYINSPGGDVHSILGIIDIIKKLPCKVNTYCYGLAASAAFMLFISGTGRRVMSKNSFIMYHNAQISWLSGDHKDIKNQSIVLENLQSILESIVVESVNDIKKFGAKFWKDRGDHDWYINSEEAMKIGLATEIE